MNEIIERVKSTDFSKIKTEELFSLIEKIHKSKYVKEIYDEVFPILVKYIYGNTILKNIYNIPELNDYCIYLLHNNKVDLSNIPIDILIYIIYNTTWGKRFFLDNIDIISKDRIQTLITKIYSTDISLYYLMLNSYKSRENRLKCIIFSIKTMLIDLPENIIIDSIYKEEPTNYEQLTLDESFINDTPELIPNDLGHYLASIPKYRDFVVRYGKELFNSEKDQKLRFLSLLENELPELCEKYRVFLKLYESSNSSYRTDSSLSNLINFGNYSEFLREILKLSPDLSINAISTNKTSTSDVFCINNTILKLGTKRFTYNIDLNFFRIIPTKIYYIKNKNNEICSVIEYQQNIDNNPEHITEEMIKELLLDFKKHGLYIADPNCLHYKPDNFGILNDYRDANLGEYKSPEDFPESFKKCPLVLLDVDLIYSYNNIETPPIHILETITDSNDGILDYQKIKQIRKRARIGGNHD